MNTRPALYVVAMTGIGIILAYIIDVFNDRGILIDEFVSDTLLVTDIMIVVLVVCMIFGILLAVRQR